MKKKGAMPMWGIFLIVFLGIGALFGIFFGASAYLAALVPPVEIDYDGEFDDGFLAIKGDFYSDFTEGTDCNISSDVLGGSGYATCIYDTSTDILSLHNSTDYQLDLVIDIDGDVEDMEVEAKLQNTGTGQAKDDTIIKVFEIWTYEDSDETVKLYGEETLLIDNEDGDVEGNTGVLVGGEYVLHIVLRTKLVTPEFADGDDIMRIDLDLKTTGKTDSARITLEE